MKFRDHLLIWHYLVWLHRIVFPGPVFTFGVYIYSDIFIHIFRVVNLYKIAARS